ncbi:MAG: glycosyltransferase family 9 protein [Polaribacter sp.]|nr:glycosyltransferase family 9 protein [Polaribacter sp.]MDG1992932.1 glycosyltransferase family 9 protein [Polaribacter sp.]
MHTNTHILVIRLSAMGDVAMTIPVVRALLEKHPEIKITFLSKAFLKPLFDDVPNVTFYAADVKNNHKGVLGLHKLSKELKQLNITHVADLHNVLRSKILRNFLKFSTQNIAVIDKGRNEKKALTSTKNKVFKQLKTSHERYADVFRKLDFSIDITNPTKLQKPKLASIIIDLIGEKQKKNWIGIAPFAAYDAKMYPLDLMQKVVDKLSENNTVLLFGGGEEEVKILSEIEEKNNHIISIAGKLNLKKELNLIAHLDCMLAMDSGNAHFAAMLQIPTVTLWGATHPFAGFAPFNQPKENCLLPDLDKYPKLPCSIYGNKVCDGYEDVMRTILPEKVIEKVEKLLN